MADKRKWDMTSTHSLEAAAEWLRLQAGAAVVVVVRDKDYAMASAAGISGAEAQLAVEFVLPDAAELAGVRELERKDKLRRERAAAITGRV